MDPSDGPRTDRAAARSLLIATVVAEIVYVLGRQFVRMEAMDPIRREILTTAWRLLFVVLYLRLAWPVLKGTVRKPIGPSPLIVVALGLLIASPLAWPGYQSDALTLAVFIATTPVVALREELAYRMFMAGSLSILVSPRAAMALSTVAFIAYHAGAQPMSVPAISGMAAFGILACALYLQTGSLALVVVLHTIVDWIFLIPREWSGPPILVLPCNLAIVALAYWWWRRGHTHSLKGMR